MTHTGALKRIEEVEHALVFEDGRIVMLDDVLTVDLPD